MLFDEPDSHLSPAARRRLANVIATIAAERELWVAFTTHSVEVLEELAEAELFVVDPSNAQAGHAVSGIGARRRALRVLGITPVKRLLVVVEDVDGEEVAWQIVNRFAEDVAGAVDVRVLGGATDVVRFVEAFPPESLIGRCVALLDGDKRGEFALNSKVLFLPGESDPVAAARAVVCSNPDRFAEVLGIVPARLSTALCNVNATDHHDFCATLIEELQLQGTTVSAVRRALFNAWLTDEPIATEASELAGKIVGLVDSLPFVDWARSRDANFSTK